MRNALVPSTMECRRGNRCLLYLLSLLSLANLLAFVLFADHWRMSGWPSHPSPPAPPTTTNNNYNNNGPHHGQAAKGHRGSHGAAHNRRNILMQAMTNVLSTTSYDVMDILYRRSLPSRISSGRMGADTGDGVRSGSRVSVVVPTALPPSSSSSSSESDDSPQGLFDVFSRIFSGEDKGTLKKAEALKAPRLDRLWNVWNITYPIDKPDICRQQPEESRNGTGNNGEGVTVMVIVISAVGHRAARSSIRDTWGQSLLANRTIRQIFLVGRGHDAATQQAVMEEDGQHGDIVQADFDENYKNLTLKSVLLLRWVSLHCPLAQFLLKIDDDVFLNPANFLSLVGRHRHLKMTIFGRLAARWRPIRDQHSHYFVPKTVWTSSIYPDFVAGPAYVMTGDAVSPLLSQVSSVPFFFLEDVYVTGILAQKARVKRLNHNGFSNQRTTLNPCLFHKLVSSHHVNATRMTTAWSMLNNYPPGNSQACWQVRCNLRVLGLCMEQKRVAVNFDNYLNRAQTLAATNHTFESTQ